MYLKRSTDKKKIREIFLHPTSLSIMADCEEVPDIPIHPLIHYVFVHADDGEVVGCYTLTPHNTVTVDIHTNFLPKGFGEIAAGAIPLLFDYIFNQVGWEKAITEVPVFNTKALRYVRRSRMKLEGILHSAFMKFNHLHDIQVYGITKEEYKCQLSPT